MKYFIDTEFIEDGKTIDLISIGIVCENGRDYYAVSNEFDPALANDWVRANVLPQLPSKENPAWRSRQQIRQDISNFVLIGKGITEDCKPQFWGYYCDYDWVVFCQLFGKMIDLPKSYPMYCRDLKQWCDDLGNPELPELAAGEHHALADALWNFEVWKFLKAYSASRVSFWSDRL